MSSEEALALEEHFINSIRAQGATVTTTYTRLLVDVLNRIVQKLFTMDPYVLSMLTDPSEANIRRFIIEFAKVITDHNG
jgi:hypothetical protein